MSGVRQEFCKTAHFSSRHHRGSAHIHPHTYDDAVRAHRSDARALALVVPRREEHEGVLGFRTRVGLASLQLQDPARRHAEYIFYSALQVVLDIQLQSVLSDVYRTSALCGVSRQNCGELVVPVYPRAQARIRRRRHRLLLLARSEEHTSELQS